MKVEETFYEHIEHVLVIMAKLSTPVLSIETNLETVVVDPGIATLGVATVATVGVATPLVLVGSCNTNSKKHQIATSAFKHVHLHRTFFSRKLV